MASWMSWAHCTSCLLLNLCSRFALLTVSQRCLLVQDPVCEDQRRGLYQARWSEGGCSPLAPSVGGLLLLLRNSSGSGTKGVMKYESMINWLINKQSFVEDLFWLQHCAAQCRDQKNTMLCSNYPHPAPLAREEKSEGWGITGQQPTEEWIVGSRSCQWLPVLAARGDP